MESTKIAMIGFGYMGQRLASMLLKKGHTVFVYDSKVDANQIQAIMEEKLACLYSQHMCFSIFHLFMCGAYIQGRTNMYMLLQKFNAVGNLTELLSQGCNIVIEATTEDINSKRAVFQELTSILQQQGVPAGDVLLCSTTAGLPMSLIIADAMEEYKPSCLGFHVFLDEPCYTTVTYQNNEQAKFGYAETLFSLLKGSAQIRVENPTRKEYRPFVSESHGLPPRRGTIFEAQVIDSIPADIAAADVTRALARVASTLPRRETHHDYPPVYHQCK